VSPTTGSIVPFLLLGDTRRAALVSSIGQSVGQWQREWLPDRALRIGVDVQEARSQPIDIRVHEAACFRVRLMRQELLVLVVPQRAICGLLGMPAAGTDVSSRFADEHSLAAALEREALRRLACVLLTGAGFASVATLELERDTLGAAEVLRKHATSRYVSASIALGDPRCVLSTLLTPALVEKLAPLQAAPVQEPEHVERRRAGVAAESVAVEAVLGNAEVSITELAALAVGDVVVLEQSLTDSAYLAMPGGQRVGAAALGRVEGKRAIQMRGRTG
jgi:hypothetical protein